MIQKQVQVQVQVQVQKSKNLQINPFTSLHIPK